MKLLVLAGAAALCAAAPVSAAKQATFILDNGQRATGTLVFHGAGKLDLIDGRLALQIDGREQSFATNDVSVIDFSGGTPTNRELEAVPAAGNLIALKNGGLEPGRFANIVNGQFVEWQNEEGATERYSIAEVSRIYLNPRGARIAYNYNGPIGQAAAPVGTSGEADGVPAPGALAIQAAQAWTPTGITVQKGERLTFVVSGWITLARNPAQAAGPEGIGSAAGSAFPMPMMAVGGLIGRVGSAAPFAIGANAQPIEMPAEGPLLLGINENRFAGNAGSFEVAVKKP